MKPLVLLLLASLGSAQDLSLSKDGVGPIAFSSTLTLEGTGARLVASAVNRTGRAIQQARFCVQASSSSCLFTLWNAAEWQPDQELHWEITTKNKLSSPAHQVAVLKLAAVGTAESGEQEPAGTSGGPGASPSQQGTIRPGSAVYVDSDNGFDIFIMAAFQAKHVPLRVVSSPDKADYTLHCEVFRVFSAVVATKATTTTRASEVGEPPPSSRDASGSAETKSVATAGGRTSEVAVKLISKSGDLVWAYAVTKGITVRNQPFAEAIAKHLKDVVAK